jgi:hypothetical protein
MPTQTIFDSTEEPNPSGKAKWIILAFVVLVLLASGTFAVYKYRQLTSLRNKERVTRNEDPYSADNIRDTVVAYLAQPRFAGEKFAPQILGKAYLELYIVGKRELLFSLPDKTNLQDEIRSFVIDPAKIELAKEDGDKLRLGDYSLTKSAAKAQFFKTAVENIKLDPNQIVKFSFQRGVYHLTLRELVDYIQNRNIYGGKMRADTNIERNGLPLIFYNHGAFVAKPNEVSLKRFADELLKNIPANEEGAREKRIQLLTDFVADEIPYNEAEALSNAETLKRPNEVLMTRKADCSNKVILLASLLEQIGEDYLMLYCPQHITVAVPQGKFSMDNRLTFAWEDKNWVLLESTVRRFQIGKTRVLEEDILQQIEYVQRPREKNLIYNSSTKEPLSFR